MDDPSIPDPRPEPEERITVTELCRRFEVDMAHARKVGRLTAELFDLTRPIHGLDVRYREVALLAGVLHNVALAGGKKKHHTRGRDIILAHPLADVPDESRAIVAVTTAFHRKRWKPERLTDEPSYLALPADQQPAALWLSALLRIADGLDYSQSQTTILGPGEAGPDGVRVSVAGPYADMDAARADEKADLWRAEFPDVPLHIERFRTNPLGFDDAGADLEGDPPAVANGKPVAVDPPPRSPGVTPDDTMAEAGRKVLRLHFDRMLANDPGTREGTDIEALHDMRVATRRMRAAFRLFGGSFEKGFRKPLKKGLKRIGRALGRVRDLDVFMADAQEYLNALPEDRQGDLDLLIDAWGVRREKARKKMLTALDDDRYRSFVADMREFVDTPGLGAKEPKDGSPALVRYVAPLAIYTRYAEVRAYGPHLAGADIDTLHALRIDAKRLRYTLEFFEEVLGNEARGVIEAVRALQDHLGALHDADVARDLLRKVMARSLRDAGETVGDSPAMQGLAAYLDDREAVLRTLRDTVDGEVWTNVVSEETRVQLARAVGVL
jgi:CHAD domain-containing protein